MMKGENGNIRIYFLILKKRGVEVEWWQTWVWFIMFLFLIEYYTYHSQVSGASCTPPPWAALDRANVGHAGNMGSIRILVWNRFFGRVSSEKGVRSMSRWFALSVTGREAGLRGSTLLTLYSRGYFYLVLARLFLPHVLLFNPDLYTPVI